jgi:lipopolysaccharide export system protein LptA
MRQVRAFILLLIVLVVGAVGLVFTRQREAQQQQTPAPPPALPNNITSKADGWFWSKTDNDRTVVEIRAREFQQNTETQKFELQDVDLKLFHKDGKGFDAVKSKQAEFDMANGEMFSDGEVEMRMGLEEGAPPSGRLMVIRSSGVRYDSKTGKVKTDRAASFEFDRGKGGCTGAEYDPTLRELRMFKDVDLLWTGATPDTKPMQVKAGELLYKELEAKVFLSPWSKLVRDTLTMDAGNAVVTLKEGAIEQVEAVNARGVDARADRKLEYSAPELLMLFETTGEVKSVRGQPEANLLSTSATAITTVQTKLLDLAFDPRKEGAQLTRATANGNSVVESRPAPGNAKPSETKLLKSDVIELSMKPGGEEIDKVVTHTPGTVEFRPNRAGQRQRLLTGSRITMEYAAANQLKTFRATDVTTRTEGLPAAGKSPASPPLLTWSKDLVADFNPVSGDMTKLEQWTNFRYEEGPRKATSDKAILDYARDEITLDGKGSRVWDDSGATTADRIVMDQAKDTVVATGRVSTTRVPDRNAKKPAGSGLVSSGSLMQGKADKMTTSDNNQFIRYEGNALVWQGSDRIEGKQIDIDRRAGKLVARGNVVSQFVETRKTPGKPDQQIFTVVRAPEMFYEDGPKLAIYYGGAVLKREGLVVDGREIRAYLRESEGGTSLDRALSDGDVKIVQTAPDRKRTGTSEHAEYYVGEEKVILTGGQPTLVDTVRGTTRGDRLTYFAGNDKLIVDGSSPQLSKSRLKQK